MGTPLSRPVDTTLQCPLPGSITLPGRRDTARSSILAAPLALLVAGLSYLRAMISDVAAAAVATIAPAPGDVVLRLAMLRSWGIDTTDAASGLTVSTILFYLARCQALSAGRITWIG
jgi:hypothetical protein